MNLRETDPKQYWKLLKTLNYEDESPKTSEIQDNFVELADHFRSQGETHDFDEQWKKNIESDISNKISSSNIPHCEITDKPFTISEVNRCIKKLKTGKSAWPDLISNEIIKFSGICTCKSITKFLIWF